MRIFSNVFIYLFFLILYAFPKPVQNQVNPLFKHKIINQNKSVNFGHATKFLADYLFFIHGTKGIYVNTFNQVNSCVINNLTRC